MTPVPTTPAPTPLLSQPAAPAARITLTRLTEMKAQAEPIVMVTAYDHPGARLAERAGADMLLVGDSGAQVVLGYDATVRVSVDEMITLSAAVRRGADRALVVCDLPFGSTEASDAQAVETAVRFVREAGADAVKLEGGNPDRASRIRAIVAAGIPVVGHVGLTPQTATQLGGLRAQGRTAESARRVVTDALAVQAAGASALVIEAVPSEVVAAVLPRLEIPVIGIGAGPADGQVLVLHDLLGITEGRQARFVKRFAELGDAVVGGIEAYAAEVRSGAFPAPEHQYPASPEAVRAALEAAASVS
ncbi:3-methyl-2-oxobutanoate hydroxymethyltransferase [Leucobacter weissii]|uniref:3-methyl-2-oxobutanoate hydroxymethyltransferase n=1 Tax=Leucobacter weissii TaxID=1983706 RepID=A0A939MI57_9MICO|nr:3-methyl-2-oxobutanoate hydroxymethyltransferase [Leucobacter weissii]MBO1901364.1 3-methyl-2-oxobutanoate hydroxymethyltransferase [Leucobacter weissii]